MTFKLIKISAAIMLISLVSSVNAASVSLVPTSNVNNVLANDIVAFDIIMDFTDIPTLGGGFDVAFDSAFLQFESYTSAGLGDPDFGRDPDIMAGLLESAAFGDFNGLSGPALVGSVNFSVLPALGDGLTSIMTQATNGIGGPFVSAIDFVSIIPVTYNRVDITGVPVPAALWLFGSALLGLAGLIRANS